ncbi:MAG: long-chain-fatty-acid--CoA ligase [Candidatus Azotimanducaceae bacterium]
MAVINTLADVTRVHAQQRGDVSALFCADDGREWTYAELDTQANVVANALLEAGVSAGERVAYLDKNSPEYFIFLFGGAKINAVSVAVNWRLAAAEMEYILNHSEAAMLLIGEEFLPVLAEMDLPSIKTIVVLGDPGETGYLTYEQWLVGHTNTDPQVPIAADDTCYQLYTSGTTGLPKGVELTHANFMHCLTDSLAAIKMTQDSVNLVCMPLFHISGSGWGVLGLFYGARSILLRDVDLPAILRLIPEFAVTHSLFVPAVLQFLLATDGCRTTDFSSLQCVVYGASPITEAILVDAMKTFEADFVQAYGLTETTGAVSVLLPEDHDPGGPRAHLLRSCGKAIGNHTIKIVDKESGAEMPEGEVGEICVAGPQIMKCYWRNEAETSDSFTDGWFHTGDAGYLREGYLYIHDRVKDMIISGGENIYPAEIENVLMRHSLVADAAVIGVPSERWGETVKAIVTRVDETLDEQSVIEHCRKLLAGYKCPTSVDWMSEIPRNPSGKILKVELRKPYWKGQQRQVS